MTIDVVRVVLIVVLASLAWWANEKLNRVPVARTVVSVLIVVVAVLLLLQAFGLIGGSITVR